MEALLLTCSLTDKFIPTVWKQMGPFTWRFPLTNRGRSTALMPGRAQGSGCLDLRSSSAPLSAPTLLHLLSLVGNWRQTWVGESRAPWQEARKGEDGTSMPSPAWILWTVPQGLMTRQRTAGLWSAQVPTETRRALLWMLKYSRGYCGPIMVAQWTQWQSCPELTLNPVLLRWQYYCMYSQHAFLN